MNLRAHLLAVCVFICAFVAGAWAEDLKPIPPLAAHITDTVGLLPGANRAALEARLADLEARKGAQVAVLIVASTQPEDIAAYSIRVVEAWKLGRTGVDDGVLFLIARDDRRMRIEVGRGLEGAIPDAVAKRIVAERVAPRFKAGDFPGGIEAGLEALVTQIEGEEALPPPAPAATQGNDLEDFQGPAFIGCVVFAFIGGAILKAIFGRLIGATLTGGVIAAVIWAVTAALVFGLIAGAIGFIFTLGAGGARGRHVGGSSWSGGGFGGAGGFGGGSSDSSDSGGGWSGGGGDFGGGGASGDW